MALQFGTVIQFLGGPLEWEAVLLKVTQARIISIPDPWLLAGVTDLVLKGSLGPDGKVWVASTLVATVPATFGHGASTLITATFFG